MAAPLSTLWNRLNALGGQALDAKALVEMWAAGCACRTVIILACRKLATVYHQASLRKRIGVFAGWPFQRVPSCEAKPTFCTIAVNLGSERRRSHSGSTLI